MVFGVDPQKCIKIEHKSTLCAYAPGRRSCTRYALRVSVTYQSKAHFSASSEHTDSKNVHILLRRCRILKFVSWFYVTWTPTRAVLNWSIHSLIRVQRCLSGILFRLQRPSDRYTLVERVSVQFSRQFSRLALSRWLMLKSDVIFELRVKVHPYIAANIHSSTACPR